MTNYNAHLAEQKRMKEERRAEKRERVRRAIKADPELTVTQLVKRFGINTAQLREWAGDLMKGARPRSETPALTWYEKSSSAEGSTPTGSTRCPARS